MRMEAEQRPTPADLQAQLAPHLFSSGGDDTGTASAWLPPGAVALIEERHRSRPPVAAGGRGPAAPAGRAPAVSGPQIPRVPGPQIPGPQIPGPQSAVNAPPRPQQPPRGPAPEAAPPAFRPAASAPVQLAGSAPIGPGLRVAQATRTQGDGRPRARHRMGTAAGRRAQRAGRPGPPPCPSTRSRPRRRPGSGGRGGSACRTTCGAPPSWTAACSTSPPSRCTRSMWPAGGASSRPGTSPGRWRWRAAGSTPPTARACSRSTRPTAASAGVRRSTAGCTRCRPTRGTVVTGTRGGGVQAWDAGRGTLRWERTGAQTEFESPDSGPERRRTGSCTTRAAACCTRWTRCPAPSCGRTRWASRGRPAPW